MGFPSLDRMEFIVASIFFGWPTVWSSFLLGQLASFNFFQASIHHGLDLLLIVVYLFLNGLLLFLSDFCHDFQPFHEGYQMFQVSRDYSSSWFQSNCAQ
jgi:hypothetical protein